MKMPNDSSDFVYILDHVLLAFVDYKSKKDTLKKNTWKHHFNVSIDTNEKMKLK